MPDILSREARRLALDILRCHVLDDCLKPGGQGLGCYKVATWYSSDESPHYVPEPWSGHLSAAPILFISSNPGGGRQGEGVNADGTTNLWDDERLLAAYDCAFEPAQVPGIADATHLVDVKGRRSRAIRYLSWLWYASKELLERDPVAGTDYAATEVVHCGTRSEAGVAEAFRTCTDLYFRRLVETSSARVIICTGDWATRAFVEQFGISFVTHGWGPGVLVGRHRIILQVPHPNRWGSHWQLSANLGSEPLQQARHLLRSR